MVLKRGARWIEGLSEGDGDSFVEDVRAGVHAGGVAPERICARAGGGVGGGFDFGVGEAQAADVDREGDERDERDEDYADQDDGDAATLDGTGMLIGPARDDAMLGRLISHFLSPSDL